METPFTAIELEGTVDKHRRLQLDDLLPIQGPKRVRVIVLYSSLDELDEELWLKAGKQNPAFDFLKDPEEDIYSPHDGKPLRDEI